MQAGQDTINILGFPTSTLTREEILDLVSRWVTERSASHHLMALNPIKVCRARREDLLAAHIADADIVYPDAFGIAWAMGLFDRRKFKTIPGCDLMLDILARASKDRLRVYLVGASRPVIEETRLMFARDYPGLSILGVRNGYFSSTEEMSDLVSHIVGLAPDLVFVGMGARIQEDLISRIINHCTRTGTVLPVLMGVGGSFDAVTGHLPRPPRWMLGMHLEWLFRLIQQPLRAPRMVALPHFAILVLAKKLLRLNTDYKYVPRTTGSRFGQTIAEGV